MPAHNDGSVPFGAQAITIGATSYVAENISYTEPSTVIERRSEVGAPSGQVIVSGFGNGSATLQQATTITAIPAVGATFTLTRIDNTTIGAVVAENTDTQAQLDARKVNINFRRRYN